MLRTIADRLATANKPIIKVLFRNKNTRIVAFGLRKGMKLVDHQLPVTTKIIILKGEMEIDSKIEVKLLEEFHEYEIPPKVIHQVRVHEDTIALLVLDF